MKSHSSTKCLFRILTVIALAATTATSTAVEYNNINDWFHTGNRELQIVSLGFAKMLTVTDSSPTWRSNVGAGWNRSMHPDNVFFLKFVRNSGAGWKIFNIVHKRSNRRVGLHPKSVMDNVNFVLTEHDSWKTNDPKHQFFIRELRGTGGVLVIHNAYSQKALDLSGNGYGFDVRQWGYVGKMNQKWYFVTK